MTCGCASAAGGVGGTSARACGGWAGGTGVFFSSEEGIVSVPVIGTDPTGGVGAGNGVRACAIRGRSAPGTGALVSGFGVGWAVADGVISVAGWPGCAGVAGAEGVVGAGAADSLADALPERPCIRRSGPPRTRRRNGAPPGRRLALARPGWVRSVAQRPPGRVGCCPIAPRGRTYGYPVGRRPRRPAQRALAAGESSLSRIGATGDATYLAVRALRGSAG